MITNNLLLRTITALLGGTLFIVLLTLHVYSYYFLWITILGFCVWEWKNVFQLSTLIIFFMGIVIISNLVFLIVGIEEKFYIVLYIFFTLFLVKRTSFIHILYGILGIIYLFVPLYVLYVNAQQEIFYLRTLFVITIVWASDISAYLIGKYFGKHLLLPRISPKKTWEGLIGSFVGAGAVLFIWFELGYITEIKYLWIGIITALATPVGDLIQSAIKRSMNIKDTSQFLPGHGGFLDRFDGFFFALVCQHWI